MNKSGKETSCVPPKPCITRELSFKKNPWRYLSTKALKLAHARGSFSKLSVTNGAQSESSPEDV